MEKDHYYNKYRKYKNKYYNIKYLQIGGTDPPRNLKMDLIKLREEIKKKLLTPVYIYMYIRE